MDLSQFFDQTNMTDPLSQFVTDTLPTTLETIASVIVTAFILIGFVFVIRYIVRW